MNDHTELNRRVADLQGMICHTGSTDGFYRKSLIAGYDPCNNWQQAGELLEKFKIDLRYEPTDKAIYWAAVNCQRPWGEAKLDENPCVAIVRAVIALLENEE